MNPSFAWMVVVSYQEWLNWVETGQIRLNNRIARVRESSRERDFAALMDLAPDVSKNDDQAFVLATLKQNYINYAEPVLSQTQHDRRMLGRQWTAINRLKLRLHAKHLWLGIEAVEEFTPVSERGFRLMEADAKRAWVNLGEAKHQPCWEAWVRVQQELAADRRGRTLAKSMGLKHTITTNLPEEIKGYLLGEKKPPLKSSADKLKATRAMAWCSVFAVLEALGNVLDKEKLNKELKRLSKDTDLDQPITGDKHLLSIADDLDATQRNRYDQFVPVRLLVVVFHYMEVLSIDKDIKLSSLVQDVGEVAIKDGYEHAAMAAYYVGRRMRDVEISKVNYASNPDHFPAMTPGELPCQLDVTTSERRSDKDAVQGGFAMGTESTQQGQEQNSRAEDGATKSDDVSKPGKDTTLNETKARNLLARAFKFMKGVSVKGNENRSK